MALGTNDEFSTPCLNGSISLPDVLDYTADHNPSTTYCLLAPIDGGGIYRGPSRVNWLELGLAVHRGAYIINPLSNAGSKLGSGKIVAIVAVADTLTYVAVIMSIIRSGNIPFPISPRISAHSVASLLRATSCHYVLASATSSMSRTISELRAALGQDYPLEVSDLPSVEQLFPFLHRNPITDIKTNVLSSERYPRVHYFQQDLPALFIHSSGSTGLPKAVPFTQAHIFNTMQMHALQDFKRTPPLTLGGIALPPYHAMGIFFHINCPIATGTTIVFWEPTAPKPPPVPTPENTLEALKNTSCDTCIVMPTFAAAWSRNDGDVRFLAGMEDVVYGGGPLSCQIGEELIAQGVNLINSYGGTEMGNITRKAPVHRERHEWSWLEFSDRLEFEMRPVNESNGGGLHELIILNSERLTPMVYNVEINRGRGYATSDLFVRHPTKETLWQIVGRLDDQITLSTGEKINPGPIEDILLENPLIHKVLLCGRERDQVCLLVEPAPGHEFDLNDMGKHTAYRNSIWPTIETANHASPAFARIFKEYVIITHRDRPLPVNPKGTVLRKIALQAYTSEIDALYRVSEDNDDKDGDENELDFPTTWAKDDVVIWVKKMVNGVMGNEVAVDRDLFEQGADSLTATFLRNRILRAIRKSSGWKHHHAAIDWHDVAFAHPTILALAQFIINIISGHLHPSGSLPPHDIMINNITNLIERYTQDFKPRPSTPASASQSYLKETVILTGSTGSLGTHLLSQLIADENVEKVWALNRKSIDGRTSRERQMQSLEDKGLKRDLDKVEFVDVNMADDELELDRNLYQEIAESTTIIIHNAWKLDFNLSLLSFESHIKSARNVIDLALIARHDVRVFFTSSIGVIQGWSGEGLVPEEPIDNPAICIGGGYGEAKYVVEKVMETATKATGLQTTNIRIGQMSGGRTGNGAWAVTDWVPILLASSTPLGCLPDALGTVSWIPLDIAARTILDVALTPAFASATPHPQTLHIVHPHPVPWSKIFAQFSQAMTSSQERQLPLVPFAEWWAKLEKHASESTMPSPLPGEGRPLIPAMKLLSFFREWAERDDARRSEMQSDVQSEVFGQAYMSTKTIGEVSTSMRTLVTSGESAMLGEDDVKRWIDFWQNKGLFEIVN